MENGLFEEGILEGLNTLLNFTAEAPTQRELRRSGSVMAKPPKQTGRLGLVGDVIGEVLNLMNPIEWMSGPGGLAHIPGTFRRLGLARARGDLTPEAYLRLAQAESNYPRFRQLSENMVRRKLGEQFKVYRGQREVDPFFDAPVSEGTLPAVTAASLKPDVAQTFAELSAGYGHRPMHIARATAGPESTVGLLPRRGAAFGGEEELLLNPQTFREITLPAKIKPGQFGSMASTQVTDPDTLLQQLINEVLVRTRERR